ncbi:hypothetical protein, partial [Xanthomonas fragariae]|uniref:hypothetical protein n=3 Tax=Xanthomonas fragariae TaxID=48664 RepID=UPI001F475AE3
DGVVILECRAAVTDGTWRLKGIFQGRLCSVGAGACSAQLLCRLVAPNFCTGRANFFAYALCEGVACRNPRDTSAEALAVVRTASAAASFRIRA